LVPTRATAAAKAAPALGETALDKIGNTPLLRLDKISAQFRGVEILAKAEWHNPGGSVKDRAASRIVNEARKSGKLREGVTLLDATSGNTGIAYAMLGAVQKLLWCCACRRMSHPSGKRFCARTARRSSSPTRMMDRMGRSARRRRWLRQIRKNILCRPILERRNWQAHYYGTAEEIWRQTEGRVTHSSRRWGRADVCRSDPPVKELNRDRVHLAATDSPFHGLEGLKHMATAIRAKDLRPKACGTVISRLRRKPPTTREALGAGGRLVGGDIGRRGASGVRNHRPRTARPAVIVSVFPDSADRYLSERFWDEV